MKDRHDLMTSALNQISQILTQEELTEEEVACVFGYLIQDFQKPPLQTLNHVIQNCLNKPKKPIVPESLN